MAPLKNSQRTSYKATYVQVSPTATVQQRTGTTTKLKRAVEKAAFVQSLQVLPQELAVLEKSSSGASKGPGVSSAVFAAIQKLVNDNTTTSTLNAAAGFADINPADLVAFATLLGEYRDGIVTKVNAAVVAIVAGYRDNLTAPTTATQVSGATAVYPEDVAGKTVYSNNASGVPLKILSSEQAPVKGKNGSKVETQGLKLTISTDASQAGAAAEMPLLQAAAIKNYQPSNIQALEWAEKNNAALFTPLLAALAPYVKSPASDAKGLAMSGYITHFLQYEFDAVLGSRGTKGSTSGFSNRMEIEPVGNLHLERIEMYPAGVERGELISSVPLAPGETVNISHKEWSVTEQEFEDIVSDYFEGYSEEGVAEKNDIAMSNDSQSRHATSLNIGASLSASYSTVTLSTNFGYNSSSDDQRSKKDSRNHSMEITKKASSRTKKDHKVTFKVTSVAGSQDEAVRVITNPSDTNTMRIDYFQLARKWQVDLLRYGLRMTYDIVIPNPGSGLVTKVQQVKALDALINQPFSFNLPLDAIQYNSLASDPHNISNYDQLAAEYDATVTAPPEARKWVNVHKETEEVSDYDHVHFDSLDFEIEDGYYIWEVQMEYSYQMDSGETRQYLTMLRGESFTTGLANMVGQSGKLSIDLKYQYIYNYAINITFICRPQVQSLLDWRLQVWNQIRDAAQQQYEKNIQQYKDQRAQLQAEIAGYDALTLRRMEQEEIMKGVLRWLFGPQFYLVPPSISSLFRATDSSDPEATDVLDPNTLTDAQWQEVMENGEFIKYIHNAIEWENVLYFTYPYFWDDNALWDFKKFLYHPDPTHRTFLRAGAARVVLTIRPGFEPSFTQLIETGAFGSLPAAHPYVTIAQEIQDFANTNYPGFPPANPEQNARPLLYLDQRQTWRAMQYVIQLLNAYKADPANLGLFPTTQPGNAVPAAALAPYMDGPVTINGTNYNGINDYNAKSNAQQLLLDPNTPLDALLPTYPSPNVPMNDAWGNPYFYKSPGDTGDYDLISFGADGAAGGTDRNADISANAEASLISTWFEYTPTSAIDIGITTAAPNTVPADIKEGIA